MTSVTHTLCGCRVVQRFNLRHFFLTDILVNMIEMEYVLFSHDTIMLYILHSVTPISFFFKNDFMVLYAIKIIKISCVTDS